MSVYYLKHPKHGTKVATEEAEMEADKKRGWEEFDPYPKGAKRPGAVEPEGKPVSTAQAV